MRLLILWATPRTVSTAFERMMIERGDHLVLDEPWSRSYYFGPDRRSGRYPLVFPEATPAAVSGGVLAAARSGPVFVKDMAYHAHPGLADEVLDAATHTFLIREPRAALRSLHRRWPDFTDEEAGYAAQRALFDQVCERAGEVPPVIDSDALRADPLGTVARWCERVGIEHRPRSLRWSAGMRPEWALWRDWYEDAARSTGFAPPSGPGDAASGASTADDDPRVADLATRLQTDYEHLRRHAIEPG